MKRTQAGRTPRAMVLGGYGLIGSACLRALLKAGYDVTGVGRDTAAAGRIDLPVRWLIRDISQASAADWQHDFKDIDVIVNASGALQSGARDSLEMIHEQALKHMIDALTGLPDQSTRFIQISAAGVSPDASTAFFATKARGDAHLMQSALDWIVLRPTLVLGQAAYGGAALLRAAAAMPLVGFRVLPDVPVQTVALSDLTAAVVQCARQEIPSRTCADLTAKDVHRFGDLTDRMRRWHGLPPWRYAVNVPTPLISFTAKVADALGWLGWRSPLRSTALTVLKDGISGDSTAWLKAGGTPCRPLEETLTAYPTTVQDRWFARLFLMLPLAIATLSLFWLLSGLIGLIRADIAMETLTSRDISPTFAGIAVIGGGVLDILLGGAILFRRHARRACFGMIALSVAYLAGGTLMTPDLWADPLGPFVKVLPAMTLAALTAIFVDDR